MRGTALSALLALAVTGVAAPAALAAHADLIGLDRKPVGTALLTAGPQGVMVHIEVKGLPPGPHGIHIHAAARCVPPFSSAGPHFNPENHKHGLASPDGGHMGDLPNLVVGKDGAATADFLVKGANLNGGFAQGATTDPGPGSLIVTPGTSIVIHAKEDDGKTDPAGNSGDRIACGIVQDS